MQNNDGSLYLRAHKNVHYNPLHIFLNVSYGGYLFNGKTSDIIECNSLKWLVYHFYVEK